MEKIINKRKISIEVILLKRGGYKMANEKISSYLKEIEAAINHLVEIHKKYSDTKYLLAFRGEAKDYADTSMMPSLFRDEMDVQKESYLFELLGDFGFLENKSERNIDKAIEAQHYVAISRMLDISFSVLPAIYFACSSHKEEDGFLFVFCFPENYSPHSRYIEQFYTKILENKKNNIAYPGNFKVISHSYSNERIKAQVGGFVFFPGYEFRPIQPVYYKKITILAEDKTDILKRLDEMFNINEATLFPEKEKISGIIKERFKENTYSIGNITIENEVDSYCRKIEYESRLMMDNENTDITDKKLINFLRKLRKEESDLVYYVSMSAIEDGEKKKLINRIRERFEIIKIKYNGR